MARSVPLQVPELAVLWQGSVLASIVHAVMNTRFPDLSHEQSWDGFNYSMQNSSGARGTVTFSGRDVVAAFFDATSPEGLLKQGGSNKTDVLLTDISDELRTLANEETLQYLLQDIDGQKISLITAAFWIDNGRFHSNLPWSEVVTNGAHLIERQLLDQQSGMRRWMDDYRMTLPETNYVRALTARRLAAKEIPIRLTDDEEQFLIKNAESKEALDEALASLREIGISDASDQK